MKLILTPFSSFRDGSDPISSLCARTSDWFCSDRNSRLRDILRISSKLRMRRVILLRNIFFIISA